MLSSAGHCGKFIRYSGLERRKQARITFSFMGDPEYAFPPGQTQRGAGYQTDRRIQGLPLQFSGNNLVKSIRSGTPQDSSRCACWWI
jgi:hypothetical protein